MNRRCRLLLGLGVAMASCSETAPTPQHTSEMPEAPMSVTLSPGQRPHVEVSRLERTRAIPRQIVVNGVVEMLPGGAVDVRAATHARVAGVYVQTGQRVDKGQKLALLSASAVARARAAMLRGQAMKERAQQLVQQEERLQGLNATSVADLTQAREALALADAEVLAASGELQAWGANSEGGPNVVLRSPVAGIVTQVRMATDSVVAADSVLMRIVDPELFTLVLQVPQSVALDVALETATVYFPGERVCHARVSGHLHYVDPNTRAVPFLAKAESSCLEYVLEGAHVRAEMPLNAAQTNEPLFRAPRSAVTTYQGGEVVFSVGKETGEYRVVPVESVEIWGDQAYFRVPALAHHGLPSEGETAGPKGDGGTVEEALPQVAVGGVVLLKGELLRAQLE